MPKVFIGYVILLWMARYWSSEGKSRNRFWFLHKTSDLINHNKTDMIWINYKDKNWCKTLAIPENYSIWYRYNEQINNRIDQWKLNCYVISWKPVLRPEWLTGTYKYATFFCKHTLNWNFTLFSIMKLKMGNLSRSEIGVNIKRNWGML